MATYFFSSGQKEGPFFNIKKLFTSNVALNHDISQSFTIAKQIEFFINSSWKLHRMLRNLESLTESHPLTINTSRMELLKLTLTSSIVFCLKAIQHLISTYLDEVDGFGIEGRGFNNKDLGAESSSFVPGVLDESLGSGDKPPGVDKSLNIEEVQQVIDYFSLKMHQSKLSIQNAANLYLSSKGYISSSENFGEIGDVGEKIMPSRIEGNLIEHNFVTEVLKSLNQKAVHLEDGVGLVKCVFDILKKDSILRTVISFEEDSNVAQRLDEMLKSLSEIESSELTSVARVAAEIKEEEMIRESLKVLVTTEAVRWSLRKKW